MIKQRICMTNLKRCISDYTSIVLHKQINDGEMLTDLDGVFVSSVIKQKETVMSSSLCPKCFT